MAPAVRFLQLVGVGVDTIDRAAVAAAGVAVAYNPAGNKTGVWVVDVHGVRVVINAAFTLDASDADRAELREILDSLSIE